MEVKPGMILARTNYNRIVYPCFYKVLKVSASGKTFTCSELDTIDTRSDDNGYFQAGWCVPDTSTGAGLLKGRIKDGKVSVETLDGYRYAHEWDGEEAYFDYRD